MVLRTLARTSLLVLLATAVAAPSALGATAAKKKPKQKASTAAAAVAPILFPVVGAVDFRDDFGEPRGQGGHEGNDLMAARRAPAVAVEAGRVRIYDGSSRAGCMLYLDGDSGTEYLYIHLNNDRGAGNDNRGGCGPGVSYAPGLADGSRVEAGELVGYVGDSGDANWASPHLHFELHPGGGGAVSPFPWLSEAPRLLYAIADTPRGQERIAALGGLMLALAGTVVSFDGTLLTLDVNRVRPSTGERPILSERQVALALAPAIVVEQSSGAGRQPAVLTDALVGRQVTVWTAVFAHSLEAQLALPGTLAAARVLLAEAPAANATQRSGSSRGSS